MPRLSTALPRRRQCGTVARRWIEEQLGDDVAPRPLLDLQLVVTELVSNAYQHGEGEMTLVLEVGPAAFHVEVIDEGRGAALEIREQKEFGPGGLGLRLVDTLSSAWGAYEGTTHVWADVPRTR